MLTPASASIRLCSLNKTNKTPACASGVQIVVS